MILPKDYEKLSDEKLLTELTEIYEDKDVAQYLLDVVRGNIEPDEILL